MPVQPAHEMPPKTSSQSHRTGTKADCLSSSTRTVRAALMSSHESGPHMPPAPPESGRRSAGSERTSNRQPVPQSSWPFTAQSPLANSGRESLLAPGGHSVASSQPFAKQQVSVDALLGARKGQALPARLCGNCTHG